MDKTMVQHPGQAVQAELERRGWTHSDLADRIDKHKSEISPLVSGRRNITADFAVALGAAFGNGAEYWLTLQKQYDLSLVHPDRGAELELRTRLHNMAPIREMEKRGWIRPTKNLSEVEEELRRFFQVDSLDDVASVFPIAFRKSDQAKEVTPSQRAWCVRAKRLARAQHVAKYDESKISQCIAKLKIIAAHPEETRKVPKVLAEFGIRFVVLEPLPGTRIDGAAMWLDGDSPVIAVTIRYDRIDSFWYTLCHELAHIKNKDGGILLDIDLIGDNQIASEPREEIEARADFEAASMLIPRSEIESFIVRVRPLYSKTRIIQLANRLKVHPGIIVGQLQHRGEIGYSANREMLIKIRDIATSAAVVDGWGTQLSTFNSK